MAMQVAPKRRKPIDVFVAKLIHQKKAMRLGNPRADTVVPANHAMAYHTPFELYDLEKDPWEQKDVATDPAYAATLRDLRASLAGQMQKTQDPILQGAVTSPLHRKSQAWLLGKS